MGHLGDDRSLSAFVLGCLYQEVLCVTFFATEFLCVPTCKPGKSLGSGGSSGWGHKFCLGQKNIGQPSTNQLCRLSSQMAVSSVSEGSAQEKVMGQRKGEAL